jgi:hypothetical protein
MTTSSHSGVRIAAIVRTKSSASSTLGLVGLAGGQYFWEYFYFERKNILSTPSFSIQNVNVIDFRVKISISCLWTCRYSEDYINIRQKFTVAWNSESCPDQYIWNICFTCRLECRGRVLVESMGVVWRTRVDSLLYIRRKEKWRPQPPTTSAKNAFRWEKT